MPTSILRRLGSLTEEKRDYALVGECYIHGLMNGEGLSMGEVEEVELV